MSNTSEKIVLKFSCKDRPGIVADVASLCSLQGFNIREAAQFEDVATQRFFMRTLLESVEGEKDLKSINAAFKPLAERYAMDWDIHDATKKMKIVIAVSKWGHCLNNLLNNWKNENLPVDIAAVVSNHDDMRGICEWYGVPYYHLPVTPETKPEQEAKMCSVIDEHGAELLVLARYMQVLSNDMCENLQGRAINIHHSFLPGFKGAKPYHQAYDRGVKLIGATAHFVTADLDEGPIIEQSVERVSHANSPEELVKIGRDIEAITLQRAVSWYAEQRILLNGTKTVVFSR